MSETVGDLSIEQFTAVVKEIVKSTPPTIFSEEVERIVESKFEEERKNFWVPAEKHYKDHLRFEQCAENYDERNSNHEFVSGMRENGQQVWNVGLKLAVVGTFGFIAATFWDGITHFFQNILGAKQ